MNSLSEAINWDGTYINLCLFTIVEKNSNIIDLKNKLFKNKYIKISNPFPLEDEEGLFADFKFYSYDIRLDKNIDNLNIIITECLNEIFSLNTKIAWFAFDGSFDFNNIFTDKIADQIYGFIDVNKQLKIALNDEYRGSEEWLKSIKNIKWKKQ